MNISMNSALKPNSVQGIKDDRFLQDIADLQFKKIKIITQNVLNDYLFY